MQSQLQVGFFPCPLKRSFLLPSSWTSGTFSLFFQHHFARRLAQALTETCSFSTSCGVRLLSVVGLLLHLLLLFSSKLVCRSSILLESTKMLQHVGEGTQQLIPWPLLLFRGPIAISSLSWSFLRYLFPSACQAHLGVSPAQRPMGRAAGNLHVDHLLFLFPAANPAHIYSLF